MPQVAIFLNQCLPVSEIFVAQQAQALRRYAPLLIACNSVTPSVAGDLPSVILNADHSVAAKVREQLFKATGHSMTLQREIAKADLVHAHFGPTGWLASGLAQRAGKPLVVTFHGFDVLKNEISWRRDGLLQALYARNRAKLAARAARFLCVSHYIRDRAIAFGFPAEKCVVQPLGIPLRRSGGERPAFDSSRPSRLLAVGRLVPFKGHAKLLAAIALLQKAGRDVSLDIVGDGPLRAELEAQARNLKNCTFHGAQSHDRVIALLRDSDIFCHTSHLQPNGQTEALGLVLLEAQLSGLPVVAFASGGVPEAFQDGVTGLAVPEGDVDLFANAVARLIDAPDLRRRMAEAAPEFVAQNFNNEKLTAGLEIIYDDVIAQARGK